MLWFHLIELEYVNNIITMSNFIIREFLLTKVIALDILKFEL